MTKLLHYILLEKLAQRVVNNDTTLDDAKDILGDEYTVWYVNNYLPKFNSKKIKQDIDMGIMYQGICTKGVLKSIDKLKNICNIDEKTSDKIIAKLVEALESLENKNINTETALLELINIYGNIIQFCDNSQTILLKNYNDLVVMINKEKQTDYYRGSFNKLIELKYEGIKQMAKITYENNKIFLTTTKNEIINRLINLQSYLK